METYLDYAATTPTDPRVIEAMLPYFTEIFGNPASTHKFGNRANRALKAARATIANILNCTPDEIVFTGCGSESDNLALRGSMLAAKLAGKHGRIITAQTEHHAVSVTAVQLGASMGQDIEITFLPVEPDARISVETLTTALRDNPAGEDIDRATLVSLMYANNEVGTIQSIRELAAVTHEHGALFHTDAVQAGGQLPLDVKALGVDMLSLSAHKFYGPKGVGLLYVRDGVALIPSQTGGGQEDNRRAGTVNVPLIVGMAKALELAYTDRESRITEYRRHRDRLIEGILSTIPGVYLTGARKTNRLPNHASFAFDGINGNTLLMHLDMQGIAASSGSACNTGNPEPSAVLLSMGYDPVFALSGIRFTVGAGTRDEDIDHVLAVLPDAVQKIRAVQITPVSLNS